MIKLSNLLSEYSSMWRIIKQVSFFFLLSIFNMMAQATDKNITLAFFIDPNTNIYMKWSELIYSEALTRLNIKFSYVFLPAIRASLMADLGTIDGEIIRAETYGDEHPNLIRIEEPITIVNLSAFAYDPKINLNSWEDVKNSHYKIEYYRGQHLAGQRLSQYVSSDRLSHSSSPTQSLRKLLRGRIDVYIGTEQIVNALLTTPEFIDTEIKMLTDLENIYTYGYLNKRHSELAIKLTQVFKKMKSEGKFDDYYHQALQHIETQKK